MWVCVINTVKYTFTSWANVTSRCRAPQRGLSKGDIALFGGYLARQVQPGPCFDGARNGRHL